MTNEEKLNRVMGSLIGFAIGDAMGATTEFMEESEIKRTYGRVDHIVGGGWLNLTPGEVTDDTQMMMCVAEACWDRNFLIGCCDRFQEWFRRGPKDVGGACREAIIHSCGKTPSGWMKASKDRQKASGYYSYGNGAVMRALYPILLGKNTWAKDQGRLTHNNIISDRGIKLYAQMINLALKGEKPSFHQLSLLPLSPTGHVKNSVLNSIYWVSTTSDFREAILGAVNHGGDADTIAALTGGIAGALYGFENIPQEWVSELDPHIVKRLRELARKVFSGEGF